MSYKNAETAGIILEVCRELKESKLLQLHPYGRGVVLGPFPRAATCFPPKRNELIGCERQPCIVHDKGTGLHQGLSHLMV